MRPTYKHIPTNWICFALILLAFSTCFAGGEEITVVLHPSPRCVDYYFECEFDFPVFQGMEFFSVPDSDRVAAFATGWKKWQGSPSLRDYDVLCYIPAKLDNPFRYVFFDVGKGSSAFQIKGNKVYRDSKLYGISVRSEAEWDEALKIGGELTYLYMDCELEEDLFLEASRTFNQLRYFCTSQPLDLIMKFIENCPVEYFHPVVPSRSYIKPPGDNPEQDLSEFLFQRNIRNLVETCSTELNIKSTTFKENENIRFITIGTAEDRMGWKLSLFPSLEGIIILSNYEKEHIHYLLSTLPKLRILVEFGGDYARSKVYLPTNLLVSQELEHLHLTWLKLPPGIRLLTKKLTSLTLKDDIAQVASSIDLTNIEYISLKTISDWSLFSESRNLKNIDVISLDKPIPACVKLHLSRLRVYELIMSLSGFASLTRNSEDGEITCSYFELLDKDKPTPAENISPPKFVRVFSLLSKKGDDQSQEMMQISSYLKNCPNVVLIANGKLDEKTVMALRESKNIKLFGSRDKWEIKSTGGVIDFSRFDDSVPTLGGVFTEIIDQRISFCSVLPESWYVESLLGAVKSLRGVTRKR